MQEIWKNIEWYKWVYQVSNLWNIRSTNYRLKWIIKELKLRRNDRYTKVTLFYQWIESTKNVHRLVAETFIKKPYNKNEVNHKDFNKHNNVIDNLEWVTQEENRKHYLLFSK